MALFEVDRWLERGADWLLPSRCAVCRGHGQRPGPRSLRRLRGRPAVPPLPVPALRLAERRARCAGRAGLHSLPGHRPFFRALLRAVPVRGPARRPRAGPQVRRRARERARARDAARPRGPRAGPAPRRRPARTRAAAHVPPAERGFNQSHEIARGSRRARSACAVCRALCAGSDRPRRRSGSRARRARRTWPGPSVPIGTGRGPARGAGRRRRDHGQHRSCGRNAIANRGRVHRGRVVGRAGAGLIRGLARPRLGRARPRMVTLPGPTARLSS